MWKHWRCALAGGLLLALSTLTDAQWGMQGGGGRQQRRRGDGAVRPEDVPGGLSFENLQRIAKAQQGSGGLAKTGGLGAGGDLSSLLGEVGLDDFNPKDMGLLIDQMLEMPEVQELMEDPEKLRAAMEENPLFSQFPGMKAILDSPEFQDPTKLKNLFQDGLKQFKEIATSVGEILADPEKKEQVMDELIKGMMPEERDRMQRLMSGDPDAVEEAANKLAEMLESAGKEFKTSLDDPEKMEEVRKLYSDEGFMEGFRDPDLRAAAKDPEKWRELMKENAKLMFADPEPAPKGRRQKEKEEL